MMRSMRTLAILFLVGLVLVVPAWIAWEKWRAHTLFAFCKEVQVGMPFSSLLRLERQHWIGESYLVQALFKDYVDQAHSQSLEFRSHMLDPDFACFVTHDGTTVTNVQLLKLQ
jgi:hypothetical protein